MSNKGWGGARKGAGAPVTVGDEGRRKVRAISLNDKEYEKLTAVAQKNAVSVSQLIRDTFKL
mgnify:FL=1